MTAPQIIVAFLGFLWSLILAAALAGERFDR